METQEVTLHNELKHKSIFLRDFTTAAQMLRQLLRRCFGRCCADASAVAAQMLWQVLLRCFGRCCSDASAVAAQMLRQVLRRCFGRCCTDASAVAAQMFRQLLRRCFGSCCDRAVSGVWRVGIGVVWNAGIRGMDGVAGNKMSINEISILVVS